VDAALELSARGAAERAGHACKVCAHSAAIESRGTRGQLELLKTTPTSPTS